MLPVTPTAHAAGPLAVLDEYGYVWLPYAIAALALLALGGWLAVQRSRGPVALTRSLLIRAGVLAVLAAVAAALADGASDGAGLTVIDRPVWQWAIDHRSAGLTPVVKTITQIGSTVTMTVICVLLIGYLSYRKRWDDAVLAAVTGAGAGLLVVLGKKTVGRERPPVEFRLVTETNESFPSGHALASIAILGLVAVLLRPLITGRAGRISLIAGVAVAVVLIGASRIYLGVHWTTDVLGGWTSGAAWLLVCVTGRRVWRSRRAVTAAAAEAQPGTG
jgi:membrane-associated phospholipid phosphatase